MTDRELLELAAKAAGYEYECTSHTGHADNDQHQIRGYFGNLEDWNPLDDDGDALRLAVKFRLTISWDRFDGDEYATATPPYTHQGYDCIVDKDPQAATRRAIVRAVAALHVHSVAAPVTTGNIVMDINNQICSMPTPALTEAEIFDSWNQVRPLLHPETTIEHAFYLGYRKCAVRGKV